jgi:exosortase
LVPVFAAVLLWLRRDETAAIIKSVAVIGGILLGVGLLLCALPFAVPGVAVVLGRTLGTTVVESVGVGMSVAGALLLIQQPIRFAGIPASDRWIGFAVLMGADLIRLWATYTSRYAPERFSFILALVGVFVMVGGVGILRWAGWPIAFLIFMLPLPAFLDAHLSKNLQTAATEASTFLLQTVGIESRHVGNEIHFFVGTEEQQIEVAEACSGLRMLTIFGALSFAVVLLIELPLWQRIVILFSSVPIALAVNIMRITLTAMLFMVLPESHEDLRKWVHDMWGWVMMPMALGLMFLEFQILSHLVIEDEEDLTVPISLGAGSSRPLPERAATPTKAPRQPAPNR